VRLVALHIVGGVIISEGRLFSSSWLKSRVVNPTTSQHLGEDIIEMLNKKRQTEKLAKEKEEKEEKEDQKQR
jgi:hypothetical protein